MPFVEDLLTAVVTLPSRRPAHPEHRQIELYSKRRTLTFADAAPPSDLPTAELAGLCRAFFALDALYFPAGGGMTWEAFRDLPRPTTTEKVVAELYRILRVARRLLFHPRTEIELRDGAVRINGIIDPVVLSLDVTPAGLRLLESAVAWYLEARAGPYPEAYVEAMLLQYHADIVDEIRRFHDEGRALYQFRRKRPFNRHFRFDCDNPRMRVDGERLTIEIGPTHRDPFLHPIDFFIGHGDALHIVPVEALADGALPLAELDRWRIRTADAQTLPAAFRARFGRDVMAVGQPMT